MQKDVPGSNTTVQKHVPGIKHTNKNKSTQPHLITAIPSANKSRVNQTDSPTKTNESSILEDFPVLVPNKPLIESVQRTASPPIQRQIYSRVITNSKGNWNQTSGTHQTHSVNITKSRESNQHVSRNDCQLLGSGTAPGLKTVTVTGNHQGQNPNRTCIGVFVSRLQPKTTTQMVELYVYKETGFNIKAEKLHSRNEWYSSFFIRCHSQLRSDLLRTEVWPRGAFFKPYFN